MKKIPAARLRALQARFGSKVLGAYLDVSPTELKKLASGKGTAKQAAALAKLAGSQKAERKLLRLAPVDLATRAGVTLSTAKKWRKAGTLGTSHAARVLLLNTHALGGLVSEEALPRRVNWVEHSYTGYTTRGHVWQFGRREVDEKGNVRGRLDVPILLTESSLGAMATWLSAIEIPARWRGRGASVLITAVADCKLREEVAGPGSGGQQVKMGGKGRRTKVRDMVLSSGKQSKKDVAVSVWVAEASAALPFETTVTALELKVYRDK